jgi:hypothetical protein
MVSVLGDGVVFRCAADTDTGGSLEGQYVEDIPIDYFNRRFDGLPRLLVHFGYGTQYLPLHQTRKDGTLFQIHMWWHVRTLSLAPESCCVTFVGS